MKYFLFLLSFVAGFIILKIEFLITSIILIVFLVIIFFLRKFKFNKLIKYVVAFLSGILIFSSISLGSSSKEYINDGIFVVKKAQQNYLIISNYFSNYYVYEKNNSFDEGDIIQISGSVSTFRSTTIESQFDFGEYLETYGVKNQVYIKDYKILIENIFSSKDFEYQYLDKYNEETSHIIAAFHFNSEDRNNKISKYFENLNILNLLSNSGLLFSFVFDTFLSIFNLYLHEKKSYILSGIICFPYLLFNPFSFGIHKVFLLRIFSFLAKNTKKFENYTYLDRVSIVSLILVLIDPMVVTRIEFFLSVGLSILYVVLHTNFFYKDMPKKEEVRSKIKIKLIFFLVLLPINISMNNHVNIFTIFSQIIFIPIFKVIYLISYVSFFIGYNPILNLIVPPVVNLIKICDEIFPSIYAPPMNFITLNIYYLFLIFICFCYERGLIKLVKKFVVIDVLLIFIYLSPLQNINSTEVYFLNVGQGDSIIIRDNFTTCMIDTGGLKYMDVARDSIIPFLKKKQIYNIDTLFITHDDFDHCGSYESLMKNFHIKETIRENSFIYHEIGNLKFQNLNTEKREDKNESSLILYLDLKGNKFLFMGDASVKNELEILEKYPDLKVDYLKVGHHGSNTSTSEEFITSIIPKEAIISCGENNSYGHPHESVIQILEKYDVNIRRTDLEGTIMYKL